MTFINESKSNEEKGSTDEIEEDDITKNDKELNGMIIENLSNQPVEVWWANPTGADERQGSIQEKDHLRLNTFIGHKFFFTQIGYKSQDNVTFHFEFATS